MIYEKDKIRRLIEYKDKIIQPQLKNDLEWILGTYNEYFINSNEYEYQRKEYKNVLNKYYNSEDEKENLKEELVILKQKYKQLKTSCRNFTSMI